MPSFLFLFGTLFPIRGPVPGLLTLFERTYDAEYFRKYKRFRLPGKQRIVDLSLCLVVPPTGKWTFLRPKRVE